MSKFYEPKHVGRVVGNIVSHPGRSAKKLFHNPADMLVGDNIRRQGFYKNIIRPAAKIASGAAAGFVGSGFNPLGAVAGGIASAAGGGLTNNPFRPLPNLVGPAAVGTALGFGPQLMSGAKGLASDIGFGSGGEAASSPFSFGHGLMDSGSILSTPGINPAASGGPGSILGNILGEGTSFKDVLGMGLQLFGGQKPVPGQITAGQRAQALERTAQLADPTVIRQRMASLRNDPNIQAMLKDLRKQIAEDTRREYLSNYSSAMSRTGGWGGSQQVQLEQQMAADLSERIARAENDFLLQQLAQELNTNMQALQQQLGQQPLQQDTRLTALGKLLAGL